MSASITAILVVIGGRAEATAYPRLVSVAVVRNVKPNPVEIGSGSKIVAVVCAPIDVTFANVRVEFTSGAAQAQTVVGEVPLLPAAACLPAIAYSEKVINVAEVSVRVAAAKVSSEKTGGQTLTYQAGCDQKAVMCQAVVNFSAPKKALPYADIYFQERDANGIPIHTEVVRNVAIHAGTNRVKGVSGSGEAPESFAGATVRLATVVYHE